MTIREACNKNIHAKTVEYELGGLKRIRSGAGGLKRFARWSRPFSLNVNPQVDSPFIRSESVLSGFCRQAVAVRADPAFLFARKKCGSWYRPLTPFPPGAGG